MRLILILILLTSALATTSCAGANGAVPPGTVRVVASFFPLAQAAEAVGGSNVSVTNLTAPGVEPHDLELTPDQVEAIATADLVLYLGGGFQPGVEDAITEAQGRTLDALQTVKTLGVPPTEQGNGLTADPHVWLDPSRYAVIVGAVERSLAAIDAKDAGTFAANAARFRDDLGTLDAAFTEGLAHCQRDVIVTNHEAFGYLADAYGLTQIGITGLDPEAEPDARRLADVTALVREQGITTIFTEDLVSPKVADTLAQEAGVRTEVLNTLEGLTEEQQAAGEDYLSLMRENLERLRGALGCA
jgi:zinc transport system substrate-binding protein